AEQILHEYGYSQEFIDAVKRCIFSHRASVIKDKLSIEEICVADADGITHIENALAIIVWRGNVGDTVEQANAFSKQKLSKTYSKLSDDAREYVREKYDAAMKIFY
ncbi:MAG: hypothetical protein LBU68_00105, partial [Rickettsiales bacterium]|nr:hypothetical protein [Rickettsiales bacterium]